VADVSVSTVGLDVVVAEDLGSIDSKVEEGRKPFKNNPPPRTISATPIPAAHQAHLGAPVAVAVVCKGWPQPLQNLA